MAIRWDPQHKQVVMTMTWQDARDFGYWMADQHDATAPELIKAALEGAGFHGCTYRSG